MKGKCVLLILALLTAGPVFAQGMMKARELRDNIRITETGTKDAGDIVAGRSSRPLSDDVKRTIENTSSYVVGMCDAWNSDNPGFIPSHVGWLEVMGVIRLYIDMHPEKLGNQAAVVAKQAVLEAYHPK